MKKINLTNGKVKIGFQTNSEEALERVLKGYDTLIPGYYTEDFSNPSKRLVYISDKNPDIKFNKQGIRLTFPEKDLGDEILGVLASRLIEIENQEKNMFTLHSSAVEKDGKGIVLMGSSGSGKTTTAVDLCLNHGYNLISGDLSLLRYDGNRFELLDGVKDLHLRSEIAEIYFNTKSSAEKTSIRMNQENKSLNPIYVNGFFYVMGDNCYNQLEVSEQKKRKTAINLYNELSGLISGSAVCLLNKNGKIIPALQESLDTQIALTNRKNAIEAIVNKIPLKLRGKIRDITDYLANHNDK
jgi:hypothetical protein